MATSKTVFTVLLTILVIILIAYVMEKSRQAKLQGRSLTLNDLLGVKNPAPNTQTYSYSNGKCYSVIKDGVTGISTSALTDISNCNNNADYQSALKAEYDNIKNQLSSPPMNPPNQADIDLREKLALRQTEIVNIFMKIKGCTISQTFDMDTLSCVNPVM